MRDSSSTACPRMTDRDAGIGGRERRSRARRGHASANPRRTTASSRARSCTTAPSSSLNSADRAIALRTAIRSSGRSARRTPSRQASRTARRRNGRDRRAACRRDAALDHLEERLAAARDRRHPGNSRRVVRRPAPAPSRRGAAGPRRGRSTEASLRRHRLRVAASASGAHPAPAQMPMTMSDSGAVTALSTHALSPSRAHRHRILADRNADAERRAQLHARRRAPCRTARRPRPDARRRPSSWPRA